MSEETRVRTFICRQLRDAPDLRTLTLGILKKRYLAYVGDESLSPETKHLMKRVVEEELMKMQDSDKEESESPKETTAMPHQSKRKREEDNEEVVSGRGDNEEVVSGRGTQADRSRAKKSRYRSSSSESMDSVNKRFGLEEDKVKVKKKGNRETRQEESEEGEESKEEEQIDKSGDEEQRMSKLQGANLQHGMSEEEADGEDCTEEGTNGSRKRKQTKTFIEGDSQNDNDSDSDNDNESDGNEKRKTKRKAKKPIKSRAKRTRKTSKEKKSAASQQARGNQIDSDGEEEDTGKHNNNDSSEEEEREVLMEKTNDVPVQDSDSSSLPSLEDEPASGGENTQRAKKKTVAKKDNSEKVSKGEKEEDKAVLRLKRYIVLCGVRRNYKKLLDGCRSVRSMVAILKRELEELGVQGQPSIEKCKKARLKREEAQELAELDLGNIITTEGRPKRRGASAWQEQPVPASSAYKRIVNSESDDDSPSGRGRRRATDWSSLQGIISDDGDSG